MARTQTRARVTTVPAAQEPRTPLVHLRTTRNSTRAGYVEQLNSARLRRSLTIPPENIPASPTPISGRRSIPLSNTYTPPGGNPDDDDGNDGSDDDDGNPGPHGNSDDIPHHAGDGGDGDGGDDDPDDGDPDEGNSEPIELASALSKLARSIRKDDSDSHFKIREPDTFDGSNPRQLCQFLAQCALNFRNRPKYFRRSSEKVTYALSYLRGTALDYFEPDIVEAGVNPPTWLDDFEEFSDILRTLFGPFDPVADAGTRIESLRMGTNQRITKYIVEFTQLSSQLDWGDPALAHRFYQGLPDRIKDEMIHAPKARTLRQVQELAHPIDARFWERKEEIARENAIISRAKPSNPSSSSSKSNFSASKSTFPKFSNSSSKKPIPSTSSSSSLFQKPLDPSGKIGKDGKLTPEERQ
jgi:hypothetical protein